MDRLICYRRKLRRHLPYKVCIGVTVGLTHTKSIWQKTRQSTWWDEQNISTEDGWYENFRMTREVFDLICVKLTDFLRPNENCVRLPLDVKKRVAITIYWMASTAEYRTVVHLFGVGRTTVFERVHDVSEALVHVLMDSYESFPKDDDLKEVIKGYEVKWRFPHCAGAIDGCHMPIIGPQESHGDYLNRKGWYSLLSQGVCDHRYVFRDINVGWPGRVHDARVLANSELYHKAENSSVLPQWQKKVSLSDEDVSLPVVLIDDAAYPLRPWLLKPFCNRGSLTEEQKTFNFSLSSARMSIEKAFGRLEGRCQCLPKRLDVDMKFACSFIAACVILHNVCEIHNQLYENAWNDEESDDVGGDNEEATLMDAGELSGIQTRENISKVFADNVL